MMQTRWSPKLIVGTVLWLIAMAGFGLLWARGDTNYAWQNGMKSYADSRGNTYVNSLQMLSPNEGWAVGYAYNRSNNPSSLFSFNFGGQFGSVLHYTGGHWQPVTIPDVPELSRVDMVSPEEGWAVGAGATMLHFSGGNWTKVTTFNGLSNTNGVSFNDVYILSAADGWVVGERGGSNPAATIILHYTGGQWQVSDAPAVGALRAIAMVSSSEGWAVGSDAILHYQKGQWQQAFAPQFDGYEARIQMVSASEGWASAGYNHVLHYQDGQWKKVEVAPQIQVYDLSMASANVGWAVGESTNSGSLTSAVVRYDGQSWQPVSTPNLEWLKHVVAISADEAWMANNSGTIYHYRDGDWSISYTH